MAVCHWVPSPAALTWMLMRMTFGCPIGAGEMPDRVGHDVVRTGHDGSYVRQISFTRLILSDRGMSSSSGTRSSES